MFGKLFGRKTYPGYYGWIFEDHDPSNPWSTADRRLHNDVHVWLLNNASQYPLVFPRHDKIVFKNEDDKILFEISFPVTEEFQNRYRVYCPKAWKTRFVGSSTSMRGIVSLREDVQEWINVNNFQVRADKFTRSIYFEDTTDKMLFELSYPELLK